MVWGPGEEADWYNRNWNTRWATPDLSPRKVRRFLHDHAFAEALLVGQALLGFSPQNSALVPGQRASANIGSPTITTASDGAGLRYQRIRRSGGGAKERTGIHYGPMPFEHIIDPTGAAGGWGFVCNDLVVPTFNAGNAWAFFGVGSFNTNADETSKAGAFWHTDSAGLKWKSGVYDGTGTPSTTQHETTHSDLTFNATGADVPHRLSIWFDPTDKAVKFYANGVLKDTFTPSSQFAQIGSVPLLMYCVITETAADASLYTRGGGNPRLLVVTPTD